jgi:type IX secretion system PorP/SprF family membrane protein
MVLLKTKVGFILLTNIPERMKNLNKILTGMLLILSSCLFAQQESIISFYSNQMNYINPAYAGAENQTLITSSIREQWSGIENAPETQIVSFGTPIGKKIGIGVSLMNDKTFIEKQTNISIDFSYKLQMNEKYNLYLGLKAGGNSYNVNTSGLQTYNIQQDPSLMNISQFNPNIGAGAYFKGEKLFISLSTPSMLKTERVDKIDGYATSSASKPHFYLSGGYELDLNDSKSLVLKPTTMIRYVDGAPMSVDLNTMLKIQEFFEIGGGYRTDQAFIGMVSFLIDERLKLGFAYENSTRATLANASNTFEFFMSFKL